MAAAAAAATSLCASSSHLHCRISLFLEKSLPLSELSAFATTFQLLAIQKYLAFHILIALPCPVHCSFTRHSVHFFYLSRGFPTSLSFSLLYVRIPNILFYPIYFIPFSPLIPSQIQISYFATYPLRFNCDEQHICLSLVHIFQHNFSTAKFTSGDFRNPLIPAESLHIYFAYIGLCIDNFCARRPAGWHIQWFDGRANFSLVYIFINLLLWEGNEREWIMSREKERWSDNGRMWREEAWGLTLEKGGEGRKRTHKFGRLVLRSMCFTAISVRGAIFLCSLTQFDRLLLCINTQLYRFFSLYLALFPSIIPQLILPIPFSASFFAICPSSGLISRLPLSLSDWHPHFQAFCVLSALSVYFSDIIYFYFPLYPRSHISSLLSRFSQLHGLFRQIYVDVFISCVNRRPRGNFCERRMRGKVK